MSRNASNENSKPPTVIEIEKLVHGGEGLARWEGQVILTPFVLPGEKVAVQTGRVKNGLLRGGSPEVLQASAERVTPRCEYFTACGGCQLQHSDYEFQVEQKRRILIETLGRIGGIRYEENISTFSGEPWFYRNRIQLHFEGGRCGFHKMGSHDIEPVDHCYIASPMLVDAIGKLAAAAKQPQWPKFLRSLELFTNESELQVNVADSTRPVAARFFEWMKTLLPVMAEGKIEYGVGGISYRVSRESFFQTNRFLIETLVNEALGDARGRRAVDLYAGVGLFSLPLASRFEEVQAVERGGSAFRDLKWNAEQSGAHVEAQRATAEEFLQGLQETPDFVVADPPRAGLGKDATVQLLRLAPARVAIVSCDAATLARDLRALLADGKYAIQRLSLIDLFPQTYHFETVAQLVRT